MTSKPEPLQFNSRQLRRMFWALSTGLVLIFFSAVLYFRLDRPKYELTTDEKLLVTYDSDPDAGLSRVVHVPLENSGRKPLRIKQVVTSCGCSSVKHVTREAIKPGQVVPLTLSVQLPPRGSKNARLAIESFEADPVYIDVVLETRLEPVPQFVTVPNPMIISCENPEESFAHSFTIQTVEAMNSSDWIVGGNISVKGTSVELVSIAEEPLGSGRVKRFYDFQIQGTGPKKAKQPVMVPVEFELTRESELPIKKYLLTAVYRPPIDLIPEKLLLTLDDDSNFPLEPVVTLITTNGHPLPKVTGTTSSHDWVSVQPITVTSDFTTTIKFQVHPPGEIETSQVVVEISFDREDIPSLKIPLLVVNDHSTVAVKDVE